MKKVIAALASLVTAAVVAHATPSSPLDHPGCVVTCDGRRTALDLRQCMESCHGTCELTCPDRGAAGAKPHGTRFAPPALQTLCKETSDGNGKQTQAGGDHGRVVGHRPRARAPVPGQ